MVGFNVGGKGRNEMIELLGQGINIHTMHQCTIFERIKLNGKTTPATHLQTFEKPHGLWMSSDYFTNSSLFGDKHMSSKITCPIIACMLAFRE